MLKCTFADIRPFLSGTFMEQDLLPYGMFINLVRDI